MDLFNKAKESITSASKGFTQKATDVSGLAKITLKIKEEEKQIDNTIRELGIQLYNNQNEDCMRLFPELTSTLNQLYSNLKADRIESAFLKGKKICPNCGTELDMDVRNCTACGINVENVERPQKVQSVCPSCGASLADGAKFCMNCGTKIE